MTGTVADRTGALILKATVTATNKATYLLRTTATNNEDVYLISSLVIGEYELII